MPIEIPMPRLSDTMEEGTLVKWKVKVGDKVKSGDVLADVETDKATMELQSYDDGTVASLNVAEGEAAAVGRLLLVLAKPGENAEEAAKSASGGEKKDEKKESPTPAPPSPQPSAPVPMDRDLASSAPTATATSAATAATAARTRVSPLARKIAEERGVDPATLKGSGPDGRVVKRDIPTAGTAAARGLASPAPPPSAGKLEAKLIPVSNMRKTIARRLLESKTTIPHFTVTVAVNADPLLELRTQVNHHLESKGVKLSVNDFIVRAAALAILQHPAVNSSWTDQGILQAGDINVGIAVALTAQQGGGLVVPVLRNANNLSLPEISAQTKALADKARTKGLSVEEMTGGTFTISNLGMFGVEHFEAIINPPQAAILAIGGAMEKPVVRNGAVVVGHEMSLTLSGDHRVIDGAIAAQYLQTLKQLLENPAGLLL